uniref:Uncharacterized protein n=1 Tax=uncultured bacterium contig00109 TaxID=1181574 RepID=A0A806KNY8_9BACT|nr:hypothetical protein [uncultured bacterium contig00109]
MRKAGDEEGASRLMRTAPLPPYLLFVLISFLFFGCDIDTNAGSYSNNSVKI